MSSINIKAARERAIVIGGSMAGLAAARVLSDHYGQVVVFERDRFRGICDPRRGVPQARHAHGLLTSGRQLLESYFPGLFEEAIRAGGLRIDAMRDAYWWFEGGEHARRRSALEGLSLSRPLLEGLIRERVRRIPNIRVLDDCPIHGLVATPGNQSVAGVKTCDGALWADLTVDATGRGSRSPIWLEAMGYGGPEEERIEVDISYATRRFRRSPRELDGALLASIATTPQNRRGGIMAALEGDKWVVTLYARCGEHVATELAPFVDFARMLPSARIHEVVARAEPIGEGQTFRFPASVRRRYEWMNRFPEGYLVLGDAVSSFNPVYAQGMSVAVLEARELDRTLRAGSAEVARHFFARIARIIDTPWSIAAGNDLRLSGVTGSQPLGDRFLNWYIARLHAGARTDASLGMAFQKVANLIAPPHSLLRPDIVARVISAALFDRQEPPAVSMATHRLAADRGTRP
jgi:2-polyprenyl-6-methoxyphenol hydroxylase-like FAD-dependent oxidoreductase